MTLTLSDWRDVVVILSSMITLLGGVPGLLIILRTIWVLEKNTNSIKDALVETTARASHLEGEKMGRTDLLREQSNG